MYKEIQLNKQFVALVDDEDYEYVNQWKWTFYKHRNTFYAFRTEWLSKTEQRKIKMHRLIIGAKEGDIVDHINRNGLDNRKSNLRLCTCQENCVNSPSRKNSSSKYKGVSWRKDSQKWQAQIQVNHRTKKLGCFKSEEAAARAYDEAAINIFGPNAFLNFR